MYRPLYWFEGNAVSELDPSLSLAQAPTFSDGGTTVTVTLRPYKWSNGETVDATDVVFWMNLLHAAKSNWAGYVAGGFPADVTKVAVDSATRITFTFDKPYNTRWITDNELSQITPLPVAWDITAAGAAPGSGGCSAAAYGTGDTPCTAVYRFLSRQAGYDPTNPTAPNSQLATYATNPLWQVVDGPWRLKSFDASGRVVMVPNPTYSGPVKPTVAQFVEVPFASDAAELRALSAGRIDVGYLPSATEARAATSPTVAGGNDPESGELQPRTGLPARRSTTSSTTSRRRGTVGSPARSSPSSTSARPCSCSSISPARSKVSTGDTQFRPTARCPRPPVRSRPARDRTRIPTIRRRQSGC